MKSKIYYIVNEDTKEVEIYSEMSLFMKYMLEGLVEMSEIKAVGDIDFLITKLQHRGTLIFDANTFLNPTKYLIKVGATSSALTFNNLLSAIQYCKDANLSSAGDSYIRTALLKNLNGQTKSAYGKNWQYEPISLNLEDYSYRVII